MFSKILTHIKAFLIPVSVLSMVTFFYSDANSLPTLDKRTYHAWEEVQNYLEEINQSQDLRRIVTLIPIGYTGEGKLLQVIRISKKGVGNRHPDRKPATFILGAVHANEHVSKEAVLALIDKIITGYGAPGSEGEVITYLVDAGTFYILPWANPDGGMESYFHNPYQRKTNSPADAPQIGAADCDSCGDGIADEDSPDLISGDVGIYSQTGNTLAFPNNGILSRTVQAWFEEDSIYSYALPVMDERVWRIDPVGVDNIYTNNYEGVDLDSDGVYAPYSGEDFIGGVDLNRNFGEPRWGDCATDTDCSFLSPSQLQLQHFYGLTQISVVWKAFIQVLIMYTLLIGFIQTMIY